jgi:hypothetical protein
VVGPVVTLRGQIAGQGMGNFFAELKRRHIYRVAAAYAVVGWLLLQLFNTVAPILEAPSWVARVVLLFLGLGFPVAVLLAWAFEGHASAAAQHKSGAVDWLLTAALGEFRQLRLCFLE